MKRAAADLCLCTELGDTSEFHAAARFALASCPPMDLAGVECVSVFTDGSAFPCPDPSVAPRLGWSAVFVGRGASGFGFLGVLSHTAAGSGGAVEGDPMGDSNTMELAAILWALVWVIAFAPGLEVVIEADSLFASNVTTGRWGEGRHTDLGRLCSSFFLIARQLAAVSFAHVKAHDGNPWNELADCLAKRAAWGFCSPLPRPLCELLACSDGVSWEWARCAAPPLMCAAPTLPS